MFKCVVVTCETEYKTVPFILIGGYIIIELDYIFHTLNERWKTLRSSSLY